MVKCLVSLSHSLVFPFHECVLNLRQAYSKNEIDKEGKDKHRDSRKKAVSQVGKEKVERKGEDQGDLRDRTQLLTEPV